jgi:adenylate kinase family enzyme
MDSSGRVLLITGPAGSGKSTLAERISQKLGWQYISEDKYWAQKGWITDLRSIEQEVIIQELVQRDIVSLCQKGNSVVLEFILYKVPPNPLTAYQDALNREGLHFDVVALKPDIDEILRRIIERGRREDIYKLEEKRIDAENQLCCLELPYINPELIIDSTNIPTEKLVEVVISKLNQEK